MDIVMAAEECRDLFQCHYLALALHLLSTLIYSHACAHECIALLVLRVKSLAGVVFANIRYVHFVSGWLWS